MVYYVLLNFCLLFITFVIIIIYFVNVTFFYAKLELDVCHRVDNQTSGNTLQQLTTSGKIAIEPVFQTWVLVAGCPSSHQPAQIREEALESGNLFSGS